MDGRFGLNRLDVFALLAALVTTFLFWDSAWHAAVMYDRFRPMSFADKVVGVIGWLIVTFGPMLLAVAFWRLAKVLLRGWVVHLLLVPASTAALIAGNSIMLYAFDQRDFDSTIGGPVVQAIFMFLLAWIGYYFALLYTALQGRTASPNGN